MTDPLITQAQRIIQAAIDDPTAPPTVVAWQAANAIVEEGWTPRGDVPSGAYVKIREMVRAYGETPRIAAERIVEYIENMLRTPPQQDVVDLHLADLQWEVFHVHDDPPHLNNRGVKVRHIPSGEGGIGALPQSRLANQALALDRLREAIARD